jgi:hypothetical protein
MATFMQLLPKGFSASPYRSTDGARARRESATRSSPGSRATSSSCPAGRRTATTPIPATPCSSASPTVRSTTSSGCGGRSDSSAERLIGGSRQRVPCGTIAPKPPHFPSPASRERVASAASRVRVYETQSAPHPPIAAQWAPPSPAVRERGLRAVVDSRTLSLSRAFRRFVRAENEAVANLGKLWHTSMQAPARLPHRSQESPT